MLAALTLSMVTGDSRILEEVRVAEITISCPRVDAGFNEKFKVVDGAVICCSSESNPTELMISVKGSFSAVDNRKFPLSPVKVPEVPPFTVIETALTDSLVILFCTWPLKVVVAPVCAMAPGEATNDNRNRAARAKHRFISSI